MLWTSKLADIREAQSYYQAERSDAGSLALLQAEKHRLEVDLHVIYHIFQVWTALLIALVFAHSRYTKCS